MENKKINKILIVLPVLALIVLTISATFAYYSVKTVLDNTKAQLNVHAENVGLVTFKNGVESLELKVTPTDMNEDNIGNKYYAVESTVLEESGHKFDNEPQKHVLLKGGVSNTKTSEKYSCEGILVIGLENTMYSVLQAGDIKISLGGVNAKINNLENIEIDAKDITDGTEEYSLSFTIDKDNEAKITGDIILENLVGNQYYLAGKELDVNINFKEKPTCQIVAE